MIEQSDYCVNILFLYSTGKTIVDTKYLLFYLILQVCQLDTCLFTILDTLQDLQHFKLSVHIIY